jgi:hypothetical protein
MKTRKDGEIDLKRENRQFVVGTKFVKISNHTHDFYISFLRP